MYTYRHFYLPTTCLVRTMFAVVPGEGEETHEERRNVVGGTTMEFIMHTVKCMCSLHYFSQSIFWRARTLLSGIFFSLFEKGWLFDCCISVFGYLKASQSPLLLKYYYVFIIFLVSLHFEDERIATKICEVP